MTGNTESFFETGNMQDAPTNDAPNIERGVLDEPLEGAQEEATTPPDDGPDWLKGLLGNVVGEEGEAAAEEEPSEEEPEDKNPLGLPTEAQEFISSGKGTLDDYYRQKYATPVSEPAPQQGKSQEEIMLESIEQERTDLKAKLRENYTATQHAALHGTEQEFNALVDDRTAMEQRLSELSGRAAFVNETRQKREAETITGEYAQTFSEMLMQNHGVKKDQAAVVGKKVLEDPYISELVADPRTRTLMAIPMVRDRFIKAALYDMQHTSGKKPSRAPADPGARTTTGTGTPTVKPSRAAPFTDDRSFTSFMTNGKPTK